LLRRAKDSQRFPKLPPKIGESVLLSPSGQSIASPAAAWLMNFILLIEAKLPHPLLKCIIL
jgi:hypothetical protein